MRWLIRKGISSIRIQLAITESYFEYDETVDTLVGGDENRLANQAAIRNDSLLESKLYNKCMIWVFKCLKTLNW